MARGQSTGSPESILYGADRIRARTTNSTFKTIASENMSGWAAHGFVDPTTALEWAEAQFEPRQAEKWRGKGFEPFEARQWILETEMPAAEAQLWKINQFAPQETNEWDEIEFEPYTAKEWKRYGFDAQDAPDWFECGFDDPKEAHDYRRFFDPDEAVVWRDRGATAEEAHACAEVVNAGYSVEEALEQILG